MSRPEQDNGMYISPEEAGNYLAQYFEEELVLAQQFGPESNEVRRAIADSVKTDEKIRGKDKRAAAQAVRQCFITMYQALGNSSENGSHQVVWQRTGSVREKSNFRM